MDGPGPARLPRPASSPSRPGEGRIARRPSHHSDDVGRHPAGRVVPSPGTRRSRAGAHAESGPGLVLRKWGEHRHARDRASRIPSAGNRRARRGLPRVRGERGTGEGAAVYEAADLAYDALATHPGIDPTRIFVYGRSLGSAAATHVAATHRVAGLILESPLTSARGGGGPRLPASCRDSWSVCDSTTSPRLPGYTARCSWCTAPQTRSSHPTWGVASPRRRRDPPSWS